MSIFETSRKMTSREQTAYDLGFHEGQNAAIVHGRWVDAYGIPKSKCENCGVSFCRVMDGDCYYCPNCGAKMDGGNEDG